MGLPSEEKRIREEEETAAEKSRRERERSRSRIGRERLAQAQARLAAEGGTRSKWMVSSPAEQAAAAAKLAGAADGAPEKPKEPQESREELMKLPVSKLKALLVEFGKHARGLCEKQDFVDRLKPQPKS